MRDNIAYPGLIQLMRKGDFGSWSGELQTAERLSEFEFRSSAREDEARRLGTLARLAVTFSHDDRRELPTLDGQGWPASHTSE